MTYDDLLAPQCPECGSEQTYYLEPGAFEPGAFKCDCCGFITDSDYWISKPPEIELEDIPPENVLNDIPDYLD